MKSTFFPPGVSNYSTANSNDFWEPNSACSSTEDLDYLFDETLSADTEDDVLDSLPEDESNPYDPLLLWASSSPSNGGGDSKSQETFLVPAKPVYYNDNYFAETKLVAGSTEFVPVKSEPIALNLYHDANAPSSVLVKEDAQVGPKEKSKRPPFPRKKFRETIGAEIYKDLISNQYSYDEIIAKYSALYPEHAARFTPSFCSKVRCGRIMNTEPNKPGITKRAPRVKRVAKLSQRRTWRKMTPELFKEIAAWEQSQNRPVKQVEFEQVFNVNRSTYYRWKKSRGKTPPEGSKSQSKTFGN